VPVKDSFPGLNRADHGLKAVAVDIAFGFVFVCLAPDASGNLPDPVAKVWGALGEELAPYRLEEMVPLGPITTDVWNVDWKIAMDNYLESYHVPIGHPGLYRMFTPDYDDQRTVPGVARGVSWLRDNRSPKWSEVCTSRSSGAPWRTCRRSNAATGASTARCPIWASISSRTRWTSSRSCLPVPGGA